METPHPGVSYSSGAVEAAAARPVSSEPPRPRGARAQPATSLASIPFVGDRACGFEPSWLTEAFLPLYPKVSPCADICPLPLPRHSVPFLHALLFSVLFWEGPRWTANQGHFPPLLGAPQLCAPLSPLPPGPCCSSTEGWTPCHSAPRTVHVCRLPVLRSKGREREPAKEALQNLKQNRARAEGVQAQVGGRRDADWSWGGGCVKLGRPRQQPGSSDPEAGRAPTVRGAGTQGAPRERDSHLTTSP